MAILSWKDGVEYTFRTRHSWRFGSGKQTTRINCNHFTDFISEDFPLAEITRKLVKSYCFELEDQEICNASINRRISPISTVLNHCVDEEEIDIPVPKFKRYKESQGRPYYFTRDQAEELCSVKSTKLRELIKFAISTGGRRAELLSVTVRDIDLDNGLIYFGGRPEFNTKNGDWRTVPMTEEIRDIIERRMDGIPNDVCIFGDEWPYHNRASKNFAQLVKRCGFGSEMVFHTLRHTFATWHCEAGTPIRVLMDLMGHKRIETTLRYAKTTDKARTEAQSRVFH